MQPRKRLNYLVSVSTFLASLTLVTLAACGGGGGGGGAGTGGGAPAAGASLSGTAATGMPITGNVVAIDKNGKTFSATTSAAGGYTVNVAGGTPPFVLTVVGTSGKGTVTLTSYASAVGQTVNITPLTDLIVSTAAGQPGGATLVSQCQPTVTAACQSALTTATLGTNLASAVAAVASMVAPLNPSGINPLTGAFVANGTGMDAVLDQINVKPATAFSPMATVTLIAVPTQQLGTVTMPGTPGNPASTVVVAPTAANLALAATAASAVADIQTCMASLEALYPATMTTPPTAAQVSPFIDPTFLNQGNSRTNFITMMTTLPSAGGNAQPNMLQHFGLTFGTLSSMDFSPQSSVAAINPASSPIAVNGAGTPVYAWIAAGRDMNWKFIKGAAYAGCPGGWTLAGDQHLSQHMNARVTKSMFGVPVTVTYNRELAVHLDTPAAMAAGASSVVVSGPGLAGYSGNPAAPVGAAANITLLQPPVPAPPLLQNVTYVMSGQINMTTGAQTGYYGTREAINSCQDLGAITPVPALLVAGTPCYDEGAVAPGAIYTWTAYTPASAVIEAFPYQVNAVPLSRSFVVANDPYLFPSSVTTPTVTQMANEIALVGPGAMVPDNFITYSYTLNNVYGAIVDNCGMGLNDAGFNMVFYAEQDRGLGISSCSFNAAGVGQGSLKTPPAGTVITNGYYYVGLSALGVNTSVIAPMAP